MPLVHSGKIRELYALSDDRLLLLATDKVSAYDHVLATQIPDKGAVLTQLTTWWLKQLDEVMPSHLVSTDVPEDVAGRALVVEKLEMIPIECVVRGYLAGSGWKEYSQTGTLAGARLPEGLQRGERLERPVFTPAIKAPEGLHDENITFAALVDKVGEQTALELRRASLRLYVRAERIAREHGLVLVDTKFEFGRRADGTLVLADEVLTPDSSRYLALDSYAPGTEMASLDKQQLRDWITTDSGWDPDSGQPAPELPAEVVGKLSKTYADTYHRLTGAEVVPAAPLDSATQGTANTSADDMMAQTVIEAPAAESEQEASQDQQEPATFIVDVMLREDIPDAHGAAISETLKGLGFEGFTVRQGRRYEVDVEGELTQERLDQLRMATERLLVNTEVEDYAISFVGNCDDDEGCDSNCCNGDNCQGSGCNCADEEKAQGCCGDDTTCCKPEADADEHAAYHAIDEHLEHTSDNESTGGQGE